MKSIKLTQGKVALVDDADYEWLNQWKWCACKGGSTYYALRQTRKSDGKSAMIQMHRLILGALSDNLVDHRDMNGLNNQRSNLRACSKAENNRCVPTQGNNTSGYKGVSWHKRDKKWRAYIKFEGKAISLGYYTTAEDAARAYDAAAIRYYGEFARTNFPLCVDCLDGDASGEAGA